MSKMLRFSKLLLFYYFFNGKNIVFPNFLERNMAIPLKTWMSSVSGTTPFYLSVTMSCAPHTCNQNAYKSF